MIIEKASSRMIERRRKKRWRFEERKIEKIHKEKELKRQRKKF